MRKIGELIIYRKNVCRITDIKENYIHNQDYYILTPIDDNSLKLNIPVVDSENYFRDLMTVQQIEEIIKKIPDIPIIECDERMIEANYKDLLANSTHEDLIKIIKTSYLRNKNRTDNKKKISSKDNYYFELAEKYLYNEIGAVLNKNYEETKQYVVDQVLKQQDS